MNHLECLQAKFKWAILPCLLSFGFITAEGSEKNASYQALLSQIEEFSDLNDFSENRSCCAQDKKKTRIITAFGSFFNEDSQIILPTLPPGADFKIAFPNSTVPANNIRSENGGTLFRILQTGVYEISYSFSLGSGSLGAGPIALDINQNEQAVPGTQVFIDDVVNDSFSRTVQLFLRKNQTIDVNYFDPQSTDRVVITQANISFLLIKPVKFK